MAQTAKIIDITRSFIPLNPNAFPETMHGTGREDSPEEAPKVVAYKGANFLPTAYGYKSFFGTTASLGIDALASRVDKLLMFQTSTFRNLLIALCEDGIWTKFGDTSGAWTQKVSLTIPAAGVHYNWSYCVIGNELYCYRAGGANYYKFSTLPSNTLVDAFAAGIAAPTGTVGTVASGLAAGTYSYKVAVKNAAGALSAPSAESVPFTVAANGYVNLSWAKVAGATGYRVYRIFGSTVKYFDVSAAIYGTTENTYDANISATSVTLPDNTWVAGVSASSYIWDPITITPTFLNMAGQQGIFKAGQRLGFWDSSNSLAWSSLDDLHEFTPSIQTLAGSAIFGDVVGKIVNILSHGEGFIIYATKSIVYIMPKVEATFQWDSLPLITTVGIAYPEEACASSPDTEHYAYTKSGFIKIEEGKVEFIIPELYDYLKDMTTPLYLQVLENRYLCLQLLDKNYLEGQVQAQVDTIPSTTVVFPGGTTIIDAGDPLTLTGSEVCTAFSLFDDQMAQAGAAAGAAAGVGGALPDKMPGTNYRPLYTGYLSYGSAVDPSRITWGPTPCPTVGPNGTEFNLSPVGDFGKVSRLTQTTSNKYAITDDPNAVGTNWTVEKFYATQSAIWQREEAYREAFLQAILNRTGNDSKVTALYENLLPVSVGDSGSVYTPDTTAAPSYNFCSLGEYIGAMSNAHWGINSCSFWMTRYCTKKLTLQRVKKNWAESKVETFTPFWHDVTNVGTLQANNPMDICIARTNIYGTGSYVVDYTPTASNDGICHLYVNTYNPYTAAAFPHLFTPSRKTNTDKMAAYNNISASQEGVFGIDTAFMQLTGWAYTDVNGVVHTIAANPTCTRPAPPSKPPISPDTSGGSGTNIPTGDDGTTCGVPFTPITIPTIDPNPITWPDRSVTLPGNSFLLQNGSIDPIYPTFEGMFVYDMHLKKWGKQNGQYKRLLDYSPINHSSSGIIPYSTFGLKSGAIKADGKVYLFDAFPEQSYLTYGKIGYYRLGFTELEEIRAQFVSNFNGFLVAQASLDGKNQEVQLTKSAALTDVNVGVLNTNFSGRWFDITVRGIFDINHLEFVGRPSSRR